MTGARLDSDRIQLQSALVCSDGSPSFRGLNRDSSVCRIRLRDASPRLVVPSRYQEHQQGVQEMAEREWTDLG